MAVNGQERMEDDSASTYNEDVQLVIGKGIVTRCNKLYVRDQPGKQSKKLLKLNRGDEVTLVDFLLNGWTSVITESGIEGFVDDTFVEEV